MQEEFQSLKSILASDTGLHVPDFQRDFYIQTDTSVQTIRTVLSQNFDGEIDERPVAYFSQKPSGSQKHCTATEKECLAVVRAIQHFAIYLQERKFLLQTDYQAQRKLQTFDNSNNQLMHWSIIEYCVVCVSSIIKTYLCH